MNKEEIRLSVSKAAELMGVSPQYIRVGMQMGILPFGSAVKMSGEYTYYISPVKFSEYTGISLDKITKKSRKENVS